MHALAAQYTPARPRPSLYFQIDTITVNRTMSVCTLKKINSKNLHGYFFRFFFFLWTKTVMIEMDLNGKILTVIQRKLDRNQFLRANFQPYSLRLPVNLLMSAPTKYQQKQTLNT